MFIALFREDKSLSKFWFDADFEEVTEGWNKRSGNALYHLSPEHFNPAITEPKSYQPPGLEDFEEAKLDFDEILDTNEKPKRMPNKFGAALKGFGRDISGIFKPKQR